MLGIEANLSGLPYVVPHYGQTPDLTHKLTGNLIIKILIFNVQITQAIVLVQPEDSSSLRNLLSYRKLLIRKVL